MARLHPDKIDSLNKSLKPRAKRRAKPAPTPSLMHNLAARLYAERRRTANYG